MLLLGKSLYNAGPVVQPPIPTSLPRTGCDRTLPLSTGHLPLCPQLLVCGLAYKGICSSSRKACCFIGAMYLRLKSAELASGITHSVRMAWCRCCMSCCHRLRPLVLLLACNYQRLLVGKAYGHLFLLQLGVGTLMWAIMQRLGSWALVSAVQCPSRTYSPGG